MRRERRRVLVLGATGVFGERLARRLASWPELVLILGARGRPTLERLRLELLARNTGAAIEIAIVDRGEPEAVADCRPWAVVDCAGPFQGSDYGLAKAAISCGAHVIDLADGRAFVAGFVAALDGPAKTSGVRAFTGASSTPCLSHAALYEITRGWRRIDVIEVAILPVARAPRGLSVVRATLSWIGRPVRVFDRGEWRTEPGWGLPKRVGSADLKNRSASLADTPDLDLLPARFHPRDRAIVRVGLEPPWEQAGLRLLSWLVRAGLVRSPDFLATALLFLSKALAPLASDTGGMIVEASGLDGAGRAVRARWSLRAEAGCGLFVPTFGAAALLRSLLNEPEMAPGARVCAGAPDLAAILAEAAGLPLTARLELSRPKSRSLAERVMGMGFDALPPSVRDVHEGLRPRSFVGRAEARGAGGVAALARRLAGMPPPGRRRPIVVTIVPDSRGEVWTRSFGGRVFRSRLCDRPGRFGGFEEAIGPLAFAFAADPTATGFRWRFLGWRLFSLPLPRALAPRIRARCFDRDGLYHFSVVVAQPWLGLILAYAGRLRGDGPWT